MCDRDLEIDRLQRQVEALTHVVVKLVMWTAPGRGMSPPEAIAMLFENDEVIKYRAGDV